MDAAVARPVRQQLLRAVDRLQQQEVRDVGDAARARRGEPRRQRLAALVQHAGELGEQAGQRRRRRTGKRRRDPLIVQHHPAVGADLDDAGEADAVIAGAVFGLEHVAQAQPADLHVGGLRRAGMGVVGLEAALLVAAFGGAVGRDLDRSGLSHRQHEIDDGVARRLRQVERNRLVGLAGQGERRAVLEHAAAACQGELAGAEQVAVDRRLGQAPAMRTQGRRCGRAPALRASGPAAGSAAPAGTFLPARRRGWTRSCGLQHGSVAANGERKLASARSRRSGLWLAIEHGRFRETARRRRGSARRAWATT